MRLLTRKEDGDFGLTELFGDAIKPYAILSHTWGADHEEVIYKDLIEGTGKTKSGYKKIQFCAKQAAQDGLDYFWVDTCAIDKSSSAELTEAINSMFAWYRDSAKCYVYLPDVSVGHSSASIPSQETWLDAFRTSRWFTRGWTLQELVAPASVEFFSVEGVRLGDKTSLVQELASITGIRDDALTGSTLHELSVDERMSWIEHRNTKREEDAAYSMLGIFDVHMPLIYGEGRKKAFARLQKEIGITWEKPARKPFSTIPFSPDTDFVNRPEILKWVHDKCTKPGARAALVGLGGVGKSQLAIQYAYNMRNVAASTYVFWVHASSRARFEEAYRGLADKLELPGRLDPKADTLRLVSNWLCDETNGKWTMVLDNVDDIETFFPSPQPEQDGTSISLASYLPQSPNGSILITSRSKDAAARLAGGYNNIKEVPAMSTSEALQLLSAKLSSIPHEQDEAKELVLALDCMPLAINQAAAYINRRTRMTIPRYLTEFRANDSRRESLLHQDSGDLRRDPSASNSVVTTWQMSFDRIKEERPSAAELLLLMSFFNPQGIPEETLRRHGELVAAAWAHQRKAGETIDDDFDILNAYSLISTKTVDENTWEMHPLVQFCMRVWLSSHGRVEQWREVFIELLARDVPRGNYENRTHCQRLLPHIEPLFEHEPISEASLKAWAHILTHIASYMHLKGSYQQAQVVVTKAVTARKRVFGSDNFYTHESSIILSNALQDQGKYQEAEDLSRKILESREKWLGDRHPDTLMIMGNLAVALQDQGKWEEAEKLTLRALEGYKKELGVHHASTLVLMNHRAVVLTNQGRLQESEELHRQILEGREKKYGARHPETLGAMASLAFVLYYQQKWEEAEHLNRRALEGYEAELGSCHSHTLHTERTLGLGLFKQNKLEESEKLSRRTLEVCKKELGLSHPLTLNTAGGLAAALQEQEKYEEAERLGRQAVEGYNDVMGERHPSTLMCVSDLASTLHKQGKYEEAEKFLQQAVEGFQVLQLDNFDLRHHASNLVLMLEQQERYEEAEKLNRRVLAETENLLGAHHVDTLTSVYWHARLLHKRKQYEDARQLYQRAYDGRKQKLGFRHPSTIICWKGLLKLQNEARRAMIADTTQRWVQHFGFAHVKESMRGRE